MIKTKLRRSIGVAKIERWRGFRKRRDLRKFPACQFLIVSHSILSGKNERFEGEGSRSQTMLLLSMQYIFQRHLAISPSRHLDYEHKLLTMLTNDEILYFIPQFKVHSRIINHSEHLKEN